MTENVVLANSVVVSDCADKLKCLKRELKLRKQVYPRWIYAGKMTHESAQREIALIEAIVADFQRMVQAERPELPIAHEG